MNKKSIKWGCQGYGEKSRRCKQIHSRERNSPPSPLQNFVAENGERKLTCAVTVTRTRVDPIMKMDTNIDPKFSFLRNDGWKLVLTLSNNFLRLTFFAAFIPVTSTMTPPWKTCKWTKQHKTMVIPANPAWTSRFAEIMNQHYVHLLFAISPKKNRLNKSQPSSFHASVENYWLELDEAHTTMNQLNCEVSVDLLVWCLLLQAAKKWEQSWIIFVRIEPRMVTMQTLKFKLNILSWKLLVKWWFNCHK